MATFNPDVYAYDAPFAFFSPQQAYDFIDGADGQKIKNGFASKGLKCIMVWENGFRNFTNDKVAVKVPADVKGMKVRVMENDVHIALWKAFGANPTPMAYSEVFTALQQGTIDAEENPLGLISASKFYEVQKYISLTQHIYMPYVVLMNQKKYDSLNAEQKAVFDKVCLDDQTMQRTESQAAEEGILKQLSEAGNNVVEINTQDKAVWQAAVNKAKIYDLIRSKMKHPEIVDAMLAINGGE
jgi:tripartite ATP-independent transporter DctP family solute receptor